MKAHWIFKFYANSIFYGYYLLTQYFQINLWFLTALWFKYTHTYVYTISIYVYIVPIFSRNNFFYFCFYLLAYLLFNICCSYLGNKIVSEGAGPLLQLSGIVFPQGPEAKQMDLMVLLRDCSSPCISPFPFSSLQFETLFYSRSGYY